MSSKKQYKDTALPTKSIFVTVGTTLFDPLIQTISDSKFHDIISSRDYNRLTVQYGKGNHEPFPSKTPIISNSDNNDRNSNEILMCQSYRFKPSLEEDMSQANLIISHAGAGSIMEGLAQCRNRKNVKLIVVINSKLMNNHQQELADALESRGHLICISEPELLLDKSVWSAYIDDWVGKPFPVGDGGLDFAALVDDCMGF